MPEGLAAVHLALAAAHVVDDRRDALPEVRELTLEVSVPSATVSAVHMVILCSRSRPRLRVKPKSYLYF